ncbi:MAG: hypothetical protein ACI9FR_001791 [Cryomorphaceae bacterium]|jgi:hypothetical protein
MNHRDFNRRQFMQSAFYSSLLFGADASSIIGSSAYAAPSPLNKKILVNLNLSGGPDLRHLLVPAYDTADDSFGGKYWKHRTRSHQLEETTATAQQRYEQDYVEFEVGDANWNSKGLVDATGVNSGEKFGIWREAGWLIDMMREGNAALVFSAVGGTNRAHDLSSLMLAQGDTLANLNNREASGWGGRLARSAGGKALSMNSSANAFLYGPKGAAPNYDPTIADNIDLISVDNSRRFGLFDHDLGSDQFKNQDDKMARAAKNYYAALRQEQVAAAYQKAQDHESKIREFGELVKALLTDENIPVPDLIRALDSGVGDINIDPNDPGDVGDPNNRRVLRSGSFANQIQNLYDMIAINDVAQLDPRVMSMSYGSWDSHGDQRRIPAILASDPNNPYEYRGIETGFKDIFGGQFGASPNDPSALHSGFSALWASLPNSSAGSNIVVTIAGEFGRQIRDNGDSGTDHGKGNLMFVIGEGVRGGVYGEIFQDAEVDKYDNESLRTPDIDPLTDIDSFFSKVSDWVAPGSGVSVFPRTSPSYTGDAPRIEVPGMFDNMMI